MSLRILFRGKCFYLQAYIIVNDFSIVLISISLCHTVNLFITRYSYKSLSILNLLTRDNCLYQDSLTYTLTFDKTLNLFTPLTKFKYSYQYVIVTCKLPKHKRTYLISPIIDSLSGISYTF